MKLIDTHTHLYLNAFDDDRSEVITRAIEHGVDKMLLPNIDKDSVEAMHKLAQQFPNHCFPMMGLHPTSVNADWEEQLDMIKSLLDHRKYIAIGEIGIDLYWDKTYQKEQEEAFSIQLEWAAEMQLPVSIHCRDSMDLVIRIIEKASLHGLKGIFHCFTGSNAQAHRITDLDFMLGIGGVLTFKNSRLCESLQNISAEHIVLETDAPFLAPIPFRGKRNESAYVELIANHLADCLGMEPEEIATITSHNAEKIFNL